MVTRAGDDYEKVYECSKYWMLVFRVFQGLIMGKFGQTQLAEPDEAIINLCAIRPCSCSLQEHIQKHFQDLRAKTTKMRSEEKMRLQDLTQDAINSIKSLTDQLGHGNAQLRSILKPSIGGCAATLVQGLHDCIRDVVSKLDHEQRMKEPCLALMANKTDSERGHAKAARSKSDAC